jgi:hypothetical protein
MAEINYATNGKGNLGVTLGAIGTGLGVLGPNLLNGIGGIFGNGTRGTGPHAEDEYVTRYDSEKDMQIAKLEQEIALGKAEKAVDAKGLEIYTYFDTWRRQFESNYNTAMTQQAVYNATNTANINCLTGRVAQLEGMTQLYIPATNVSPQPMPLHNSWATPSTTTTTS